MAPLSSGRIHMVFRFAPQGPRHLQRHAQERGSARHLLLQRLHVFPGALRADRQVAGLAPPSPWPQLPFPLPEGRASRRQGDEAPGEDAAASERGMQRDGPQPRHLQHRPRLSWEGEEVRAAGLMPSPSLSFLPPLPHPSFITRLLPPRHWPHSMSLPLRFSVPPAFPLPFAPVFLPPAAFHPFATPSV